VWADSRDVLLFEVTGTNNALGILQASVGPVLAYEGYGRFCLRVEESGTSYYLPWIPITIRNLVVPVPLELEGKFEVVVEAEPGLSITFNQQRIRDLDDI
jgi:hypothetical protein